MDDLNSRISTPRHPDTQTPRHPDTQTPGQKNVRHMENPDKVINSHGRKLLQIIGTYQELLILNGLLNDRKRF